MEISYILKSLRKEANITQKQLASAIGIGQATVCQWESGISKPTADAIISLCEFYRVSADFILGISDSKEGEGNMDEDVEECIALFYNLTSYQREIIKELLKQMKLF